MNKPKSIKKITTNITQKMSNKSYKYFQKTIAKINQILYNKIIEKVIQKSNYKIIPHLD